jgi:hypothetical protein
VYAKVSGDRWRFTGSRGIALKRIGVAFPGRDALLDVVRRAIVGSEDSAEGAASSEAVLGLQLPSIGRPGDSSTVLEPPVGEEFVTPSGGRLEKQRR